MQSNEIHQQTKVTLQWWTMRLILATFQRNLKIIWKIKLVFWSFPTSLGRAFNDLGSPRMLPPSRQVKDCFGPGGMNHITDFLDQKYSNPILDLWGNKSNRELVEIWGFAVAWWSGDQWLMIVLKILRPVAPRCLQLSNLILNQSHVPSFSLVKTYRPWILGFNGKSGELFYLLSNPCEDMAAKTIWITLWPMAPKLQHI